MTKNKTNKRLLVTIALTYANGPLHMGHLLEAIQADIWVRLQKSLENDCLFIGGSDAHGTAVMLAAEKAGIPAEEYAAAISQDHRQDYQRFLIDFDEFQSTHDAKNEVLVNEIYHRLQSNGDIASRTIQHAFDPEKNLFLADRFIRGECPKCGASDQYGDNCEVCGTSYDVTLLKNAKSVFSGATPIQKESKHFFFDLSRHAEMLRQWIHSNQHVSEQNANKLDEWFVEGLREWDITRDGPYFGFKIPGEDNKYFYVWLDAPVGYMAIFQHLCEKRGLDFNAYWRHSDDTELHHFIGKDILYFHALFWPAMLAGSGFRMPTSIKTHGYLTINGAKMSKSRGTFITGKQYLSALDPEYLRYYFAAKLSAQTEDVDLNLEDFAQRINSDLVGKYVNLASRCAGFINKKFADQLSDQLHDQALYATFLDAGERIAQCYAEMHYNRAIREIMTLADKANQYIDLYKPWALAKQEDQAKLVQQICTQGLNLFRLLTVYLLPVLPAAAAKVQHFLRCDNMHWASRHQPLLAHTINRFEPLINRIALEDTEKLAVA